MNSDACHQGAGGGIASCSRMSTVRQVDVGKWKGEPYIYPAPMYRLYTRSPISAEHDLSVGRDCLSTPMAIVRALTITEPPNPFYYHYHYHCALTPNIRLK